MGNLLNPFPNLLSARFLKTIPKIWDASIFGIPGRLRPSCALLSMNQCAWGNKNYLRNQ
jgi:hypothetical protein